MIEIKLFLKSLVRGICKEEADEKIYQDHMLNIAYYEVLSIGNFTPLVDALRLT